MKKLKKAAIIFIITSVVISLTGCGDKAKKVKLDPQNPVVISVWHYYNGAISNAFDLMIAEFNETVGAKEGIIVESYGKGSIAELEKSVLSSAKNEVGSDDMPNIFASYADTAYEAEKMGILADLGEYLSQNELNEYINSYIEEGKIGLNGELRIFPIAKSTEVLMLNETDWLPFAKANGLTYDSLKTLEGLTQVAELYYEWTDAETPDVQNDGKAFYGRDSMANFFIIASKSFDTEIFNIIDGEINIDINTEVMRKIWDNYYVPYICGYFTSYGKFSSDDAKVGDILAYVGSTASVSYFPIEVTVNGEIYPVEAAVLPAPNFEGAKKVMVQQGAGMVVTEGTSQEEYASVLFLKWFTEINKNIEFSVLSGYTPVKNDAVDYERFIDVIDEKGITIDSITNKTLRIALEEIKTNVMYTNKAFENGAAARSVLDTNLQNKANADREKVLTQLESGISLKDAVGSFNTEQNFNAWIEGFAAELDKVIYAG